MTLPPPDPHAPPGSSVAVEGGEDTAAVARLDLPAPPPAGDGSALAGAGSTRAAARRARIRPRHRPLGTDPPAPGPDPPAPPVVDAPPPLLVASAGQCWRPRCHPVFGRCWWSPSTMK
jgi:hypothetical protein